MVQRSTVQLIGKPRLSHDGVKVRMSFHARQSDEALGAPCHCVGLPSGG